MKNDEYQFPKDEYLEQSDSNPSVKHDDLGDGDDGDNTQPPDDGDRRFAILRNRKFVIGLLVFVVIIIGLKLMHHPKTVAPVVQEPQPVMTAPLPAATPASFALPSQNIAPPPAISDMQNHISELHDKLNSMIAANTQLTQSVAALTTQVTTLAVAVQDATQKLAAMTMRPASMKKPLYHPMPIIYVLKAVVPGRAWLIGSNGISVNVAVGNYLSDYYGNIQAINAASGQVTTTRGKVITYGANDS